MTQILDSLPTHYADRILCCYINHDRKMKVARITNIPNWYFERVLFPAERLLFEAPPEAQLEIYVTNLSTVVLVEVTACDRLSVKAAPTEQSALTSNVIFQFQ
jgi:Domain of unknown function (DUF1830)